MNLGLAKTLFNIARMSGGTVDDVVRSVARKGITKNATSQTIPSKGYINSDADLWYEGEPLDLLMGKLGGSNKTASNTIPIGQVSGGPYIRLPGALGRFNEVPRYNKNLPFTSPFDMKSSHLPGMERFWNQTPYGYGPRQKKIDLISSRTPFGWGGVSNTGFGTSPEIDAKINTYLGGAQNPKQFNNMRIDMFPYTSTSIARNVDHINWLQSPITYRFKRKPFSGMVRRNELQPSPLRFIPGPNDIRPWDPFQPARTAITPGGWKYDIPDLKKFYGFPINGGY